MMSALLQLYLLIALWGECAPWYYNPNFAPNHSVIVQLFEWTFDDIANECETYLGPHGFGGVQVSPITESAVLEGDPWWARYQPVSYEINGRSGNKEQFVDMVARCNAAGVRIYVDVVLNHMAGGKGKVTGTAGNVVYPEKREYPAVPYVPSDFNPTCLLENYQDAHQVRNCDLLGLPDVKQAEPTVRRILTKFLNSLVDFGVAGFRIDACKHMWPHHIEEIMNDLNHLNRDHGFEKDAEPFVYLEVIDLGNEPISKYEYNGIGPVTEFLYSIEMANTFYGKKPLHELVKCGPEMGFLPSTDAVIFINNHDSQREHRVELGDDSILSFRNEIPLKMATIFMLSHTYGLPRVMSSYDFNDTEKGPPTDPETGEVVSPKPFTKDNQLCGSDWVCEHRWLSIRNLVKFRNFVAGTSIDNWADNGQNQIAYCRGTLGFVAINGELSVKFEAKLSSCLLPGEYCDLITGDLVNGACTGRQVEVDEKGKILVQLPPQSTDSVLVIYAGGKL